MNKKDIKASLDTIKPDPYMETRLKTSVECSAPALNPKRFALTAALCCALVAVALVAGITMTGNNSVSDLAELNTNYASQTETALDPDDYTPTETERHSLTPEEESIIQSEIGYWNPVVSPDDPNALLSNPNPVTQISNIKLIVSGKDISDRGYVDLSPIKGYAEIPLMPVLKALSADAEMLWTSDSTAQITVNGKKYVLNTDPFDFTLKLNGEGENLLTPSPGVADGVVHRMVNGEFIIDHHSISGLINELGYAIVVDYENEIITIQ